MSDAFTEVLLHPVRIKILTVLAEQEATPQEIAVAALDVPKASLYRHLNILRAVGAIREVREHRVRGVYEKVYALETATGPLAGIVVSDGTTAARVSEWLNRMVRADAAPVTLATPEELSNGWLRSAKLTKDQSTELRQIITHWLDKNTGTGRTSAKYTVRVEVLPAAAAAQREKSK